MKSIRKIMLVAIVAILLGSCNTESDNIEISDSEDVSVSNDSQELNTRVHVRNEQVTINSSNSGRLDGSVSLTLISEVDPPKVSKERVMATSVFHQGENIVVSYNTAGEEYGGAVVVMRLDGNELSIHSQAKFRNKDISHAIIHDSFLYAAGAAGSGSSPAWVGKFGITNNQIEKLDFAKRRIGGYVATSLSPSNDGVYVTTGSGEEVESGVYRLSSSDLSVLNYNAVADARWSHYLNERLYVQNGSPGSISVYENDLLVDNFDIANAPADAKASFDMVGDYLFIGTGQNGVQIHDMDGVFDSTIPLPQSGGPDLNTNSVAVYGDMIFISNGSGVYVATYSEGDSPNPEIVGELELGDFASVNHISFVENKLIVATGLGGVKVIELAIQSTPPTQGEILSKEDMSIIYFDSEEPKMDRYASYLLDDNLNTFWHTEWVDTDPVYPHEVQVDLGDVYDLTEFRYQARQIGNFNGTIKDFELYISNDPSVWGDPFYTGTFEKTRDEQIVEFPSVTGRYLRFNALSEVNGNPWSSGSELNFVGARSNN